MSENWRHEYQPQKPGLDIAWYEYTDEGGNVLFRKVKRQTQDCKSFRSERLIDGRWQTRKSILDGVKKVPYRLPRLLINPSVVITEGEKDADALFELGFSSTCCHCGANTWPTDVTPYFAGKVCYTLYDIDTLYHKQNPEKVAASLWGTAHSIFICDLLPLFPSTKDPVMLHEKDVSDYLLRFSTRPEKIKGIRELLRSAKPYRPPETVDG